LFDLKDAEDVVFEDADREQQKQQLLVNVGDRIASPLDYITVPQAGQLRVWPYMLTTAASVGEDSESLCRRTMPDVCASQDDIDTTTDKCLFGWTVPQSEMERYFYYREDEEPSIKLFYNSGAPPTVLPICDLLSGKEEECITQYNGETDYYSFASAVDCEIVEIQAPPGVEVQAFAVNRPVADWMSGDAQASACLARACTWHGDWNAAGTDPVRPAWWRNGSTSSEAFGRLSQSFENMANWWPNHGNDWRDNGCKRNGGVCAIKVRFESSPDAHAVCATAAPACGGAKTPYVVARGQTNSIYRCARCTQFSPQVVPPKKNINNNLLFGCTAATPAVLMPSLLMATIGDAVTRRDFANGTALDVRFPMVDSPINLNRWGRRIDASVQTACSHSTPSACGWPEYNIEFAVASDELVWKRALDNPQQEFTMVISAC
jgi:hypothetical protein